MGEIVEINAENVHEVAKLSVALWPDCGLAEMALYYQDTVKSSLATCFVLKDESGYFGFIELGVRSDYVEGAEALPVAYIEGLYVGEEYRHKGYGRLLIQYAEDWARAKGFKQLCSDTELENNASIKFHTAAGFTEVSRIVCFAKSL